MIENSDRDEANETAPTKVVSPGYFPPAAAFPSTTYRNSEPSSATFRQTTAYETEYEAGRLHRQHNETKRLQRQVQWLKFLLITSIVVLGGTLSGMLLGLRQEQIALRNIQRELNAPLETPLETTEDTLPENRSPDGVASNPTLPTVSLPTVSLPTVSLPGSEQFDPLKEQMRAFAEQTQIISGQVRETSEQLSDVTASQWSDWQRRLAELEQAIQDGLFSEAVSKQLDRLSEQQRQWFNPTIPDTSTSDTSTEAN
ncbi:MAG: hypothetical protein WA885_14350 [Phormidesmis sp.]